MILTADQLAAIDRGEPVRDIADGREVVVLGAGSFERIQYLLDPNEDDQIDVAALIERVAAEDDANDPGLESYQIYKR